MISSTPRLVASHGPRRKSSTADRNYKLTLAGSAHHKILEQRNLSTEATSTSTGGVSFRLQRWRRRPAGCAAGLVAEHWGRQETLEGARGADGGGLTCRESGGGRRNRGDEDTPLRWRPRWRRKGRSATTGREDERGEERRSASPRGRDARTQG